MEEFEDVEFRSNRYMDIRDLKNEKWADIDSRIYKGYYKISNYGRVKALRLRRMFRPIPGERILRCTDIPSRNQIMANLTFNERQEQILVKKLVAVAFIPNPNNYTLVKCKDGNYKNLRVDNLEWKKSGFNGVWYD